MSNNIPSSGSNSTRRRKKRRPSSSILRNRLNIIVIRKGIFLLPFVLAVASQFYASTNGMKLPTFLLSHRTNKHFRTAHPSHGCKLSIITTSLKNGRALLSSSSSSSSLLLARQFSVFHRTRNSCYGNDNHHDHPSKNDRTTTLAKTRGFCFWSNNHTPITTSLRINTARTTTTRSSVRLFGSKRIPPTAHNNDPNHSPTPPPPAPPGKICIYDEQKTLPHINIPQLERTITILREILTYPTYDITLVLTDDDEMRQTNRETRGVDAPTDILSFPFHEVAMSDADGTGGRSPTPGVLEEPDFEMEDYYTLGDMMIDVPYVIRRCEEDRKYYEPTDGEDCDDDDDSRVNEGGEDDDGLGDRGVSCVMAKIFDPEERIRLLLVHGMLHLVGYDHIEDADYELMVRREEEVVVQLRDALKREEIARL